jgi:antirestriction protein ArdC
VAPDRHGNRRLAAAGTGEQAQGVVNSSCAIPTAPLIRHRTEAPGRGRTPMVRSPRPCRAADGLAEHHHDDPLVRFVVEEAVKETDCLRRYLWSVRRSARPMKDCWLRLRDRDQMPPPQAYFESIKWHRAALHELGYSVGAPPRLNRDLLRLEEVRVRRTCRR